MLYLVATPIGNLDDITPRALEALRAADAVACEDTRRTHALLSHFGIPRPQRFISYREQTEARAGRRILELLREGRTVALCSDGGYPGLSDPGYRLLELAVEDDQPIRILPGASAIPVALLASGLPTSSYTFKGFPPRKPGPLHRFFEEERERPHTLVVFEAPVRLAKTLRAALDALGPRRAAVCIELTKAFERVQRGYLDELSDAFGATSVRGEVTLVIAGNHPKFTRGERAAAQPADGAAQMPGGA